jgi:hypothetical protein
MLKMLPLCPYLGVCGQQGGDLEHFAGALAVRRRDDGRVNVQEPALVEKLVGGKGARVPHTGRSPNLQGSNPTPHTQRGESCNANTEPKQAPASCPYEPQARRTMLVRMRRFWWLRKCSNVCCFLAMGYVLGSQ